MKMNTILSAAALSLLVLSASAHASEAICEITPAGEKTIRMPCNFTSEKGGHFTLESLKANSPLYGDILSVSLYVTAPGEGQVSGLTRDGINSRWGEARRESGDKACWKGEDFRICARAKGAK